MKEKCENLKNLGGRRSEIRGFVMRKEKNLRKEEEEEGLCVRVRERGIFFLNFDGTSKAVAVAHFILFFFNTKIIKAENN